jgi:4-amino-4-deoxy-L-arabinose transferase-like glycosyltransferase
MLAIHAILAVVSLHYQAVTIDEFAHLPAGISHLQTGRFFVYAVNPPLSKILAALPVLAAHPRMDYGSDFHPIPGKRPEWDFGQRFLDVNTPHYHRLFVLGRYPSVLISILGGWLLFLWGRELYGSAAGVIAVTVWSFCPTVLAFAQLITPDTGSAVAMLAASYAFWHWLRRPNWRMALIAGALLGVAQLTKFTLLVLYPVWILLWLIGVDKAPAETASRWPPLRQLVFQFVISLVLVNVGYGFEGSFRRLGDFSFCSRTLQAAHLITTPLNPENADSVKVSHVVLENCFRGTWLEGLPVPLPEHYVLGIDFQRRDFETPPMVSYLRGELRDHGWWYYYLYALLVKLPLGTLVLLFLAGALSFSSGWRRSWRTELAVYLPGTAVLVLVSSQTGFSHHLRYVLPAFPFFFLFVSRLGKAFETTLAAPGRTPDRSNHVGNLLTRRGALRAIVVLCLTSNTVSTLYVYPHCLSYFNEAVGGPDNGGRHLINSNLDWGQDLFFLKHWLAAHPEAQPLGLAYFNFVDPAVEGIVYHLPPPGPRGPSRDDTIRLHLGPLPGWYAISANFVYGMGFPIADGEGHRVIVEQGSYIYFQRFCPVAKAGYSLFIYHISPEEANAVRIEMGLPPLPH